MQTLKSVIAKLKESIAQLTADNIVIENVLSLLMTIKSNFEQLENVTDSEQSELLRQGIYDAFKQFSVIVSNLSVRRGSLMARTGNVVPWKILMFMEQAIQTLEKNSQQTLAEFLDDFIKTNELLAIQTCFENFSKDLANRLEQSHGYLDLLESIEKNEFGKLLTKIESMSDVCGKYNKALRLVQAIKNVLSDRNIEHVNTFNLSEKLQELGHVYNELKNDNLVGKKLLKLLDEWKKTIGFDLPKLIDADYINIVSSQENTIRLHANFWNGCLFNLTSQVNAINSIKLPENISLRRQLHNLHVQLDEIERAKSTELNEDNTLLENFFEVKLECYRLELQCNLAGIVTSELLDFFDLMQKSDMSEIAEALSKLESLLDNISPIKEHKTIINNISNFMLGKKDNSINFMKKNVLRAPKKTSKNKEEEKTPNQKVAGALQPKIAKLVEIVGIPSELQLPVNKLLNFLNSAISSEDVMVYLEENEEQLKTLFLDIENVEEKDELAEINSKFMIINKYYNQMIAEEKFDTEYFENFEFSPCLMKLLQYQFDIKNLNVCQTVIHKLTDYCQSTGSINNLSGKLLFLTTLTKLGEFTKDLSTSMQNEIGLPIYILRAVRNKIFHVLIDCKLGRQEFWKFIDGSSKVFNVDLINGCLSDFNILIQSLGILTQKFITNLEWQNYPVYQPKIIKPKKNADPIRENFIKILKQNDRKVEKITPQHTDFLSLFKLNSYLEIIAEQSSLSSETIMTTDGLDVIKNKFLLKAMSESTAIIEFFEKINPSYNVGQVISDSIVIDLNDLECASICEWGIAYCGGLLKELKDHSETFQEKASPTMLYKIEDVILLRGELAHTVAARNSTVGWNELNDIKLNLVPIVKLMVNKFKLHLLPEITNLNNKTQFYQNKVDKMIGSSFSTLMSAIASADNFKQYIAKDITALISLYNAIQYYEVEHSENASYFEQVLDDINSLPNEIVKLCQENLQELESVGLLVADLDKVKDSAVPDEALLLDFNSQLDELKISINQLQAEIISSMQNAQKYFDKEFEELNIDDPYFGAIRTLNNKISVLNLDSILEKIKATINIDCFPEWDFIVNKEQLINDLKIYESKIEKVFSSEINKVDVLLDNINRQYSAFLNAEINEVIVKFSDLKPENQVIVFQYLYDDLINLIDKYGDLCLAKKDLNIVEEIGNLQQQWDQFKNETELQKNSSEENINILANYYFKKVEQFAQTFLNSSQRDLAKYTNLEGGIESLKYLCNKLQAVLSKESVSKIIFQTDLDKDPEPPNPDYEDKSDRTQPHHKTNTSSDKSSATIIINQSTSDNTGVKNQQLEGEIPGQRIGKLLGKAPTNYYNSSSGKIFSNAHSSIQLVTSEKSTTKPSKNATETEKNTSSTQDLTSTVSSQSALNTRDISLLNNKPHLSLELESELQRVKQLLASYQLNCEPDEALVKMLNGTITDFELGQYHEKYSNPVEVLHDYQTTLMEHIKQSGNPAPPESNVGPKV
ncbi:MAG: hypothetical protein Tsb005_15850 [Gammaproteobacteria bacterium]